MIHSVSNPLSTRLCLNLPKLCACICLSLSCNMDLPCHCLLTEFLTCHCIAHHTSSPHFPRSNDFIERQVRTIKTALNSALPAKKPLEAVLLDLRSTPIGSNMPAPHEILHNRTIQQPGRPSQPVDMEQIRNLLISKRQAQCDQFNKAHRV